MFEPALAFQTFVDKLDTLVARAGVSLKLVKKVKDNFPAERLCRFLEENHIQSMDLHLTLLCSEMLRYKPVSAVDSNPVDLASLYLEPTELEFNRKIEKKPKQAPSHTLSNSLFVVNHSAHKGKSHLLSHSSELRHNHRSGVPCLSLLEETDPNLMSSLPDSRKKRAKTGFTLIKKDRLPHSLVSVKERQLRNDSGVSVVSSSRPGIFSQSSRKQSEQSRDIWKVYQGIISRKEQRKKRAENIKDHIEKTSPDIISQVKAALSSLRRPGCLFSENSANSHHLPDQNRGSIEQIFLQTTHKQKPPSSEKQHETMYWSGEKRNRQHLRGHQLQSDAPESSSRNIYSHRLQRRGDLVYSNQDSEYLQDASRGLSKERSVQTSQGLEKASVGMKRQPGPAQATTAKVEEMLKKKASVGPGKSSRERASRETQDLRSVRFQDPRKIGSLVKNSEGHFIIKR